MARPCPLKIRPPEVLRRRRANYCSNCNLTPKAEHHLPACWLVTERAAWRSLTRNTRLIARLVQPKKKSSHFSDCSLFCFHEYHLLPSLLGSWQSIPQIEASLTCFRYKSSRGTAEQAGLGPLVQLPSWLLFQRASHSPVPNMHEEPPAESKFKDFDDPLVTGTSRKN